MKTLEKGVTNMADLITDTYSIFFKFPLKISHKQTRKPQTNKQTMQQKKEHKLICVDVS